MYCAFMPADARKTRLVRVLCTSKAYYNDGSPRVPVNDLDYMHWVNVHVDWPTHFLEPNNQNFVVERFPPEARAPSPFRYVVFMSPRVSISVISLSSKSSH